MPAIRLSFLVILTSIFSLNVFSAECCRITPQPPAPSYSTTTEWHAELTEGWDSLYMFRGMNMLRNNSKYGSSLAWTDLNASVHLTSHDILRADVWNAFGLGHKRFEETDACLMYTHTFGDLFVSLGYMVMAMTSMEMYCHELHGQIGYNWTLGPVAITPSATYFFNLGPDATVSRYGMAPTAGSYLSLRTDFSIPLYKNIISVAPWIAYAQNFRYNMRTQPDGMMNYFNGANNFELGVALPIKINRFITLSGYGAYSYNFEHLMSTEPSTFWGGAKISFGF